MMSKQQIIDWLDESEHIVYNYNEISNEEYTRIETEIETLRAILK